MKSEMDILAEVLDPSLPAPVEMPTGYQGAPCSLQTLEELSLKLTEALPNAVVIVNRKGEIVVFNHTAETLFGYHRASVLGRHLDILLPARARDAHRRHLARYFREPRTRDMGTGMVLHGLDCDGTEFPIEIKLAPLVVLAGGVFALAVIRPVPEAGQS